MRPARDNGADVFQDDELGSYQANDSEQLKEQPAAGAFCNPGALSSQGDVLARESTANNVCCSGGGVEGGDVVMNGNVGPVLVEDFLAERLTLHELHGLVAADDPLSRVGEAANAGKQV